MLIKWNEINSVNVKDIDEQHKKLIEIINEFFVINEQEKEQLVEILARLADYANYHLDFEEKYFVELAYDKTSDHVASHDAYRQKIKTMQQNLEDANDGERKIIIDELGDFLREWWINHINNVDHQYSEWFNERGVY